MKLLNIRFNRFIIVGGINNIVGYIFYSIFYHLSSSNNISLFGAYCLGIIFNYKSFSKFVFNDSNHRKFYLFVFIYVIAFILNNYLLMFFEDKMAYNNYLIQFILAPIFGLLLYVFNKKIVFNVK